MNKKNTDMFIIRVLSRENGTWQGTVEWTREKKTVGFRSALELVYLLDSVVGGRQEN